jgi:hypothetical protein
MKPTISAFVLLLTATTALAQANLTCINADPSSTLAGINGNFEMLVDPQDPRQNVIYTNNVATGASSIVVARIDGLLGTVVPGSLHTIANNFQGNTAINGPEFVQPPGGELGILYAGPKGVHGAFRPLNTVWFNFSFNLTGAPTNGSPSKLPTSIGAYPWPPIPLGQHTYGQYFGNCSAQPVDWCYGALGFGVSTDVGAVLKPQGFSVSYTVQSPRDGYIFVSACQGSNCGLFEGKIDNAGGLALTTVSALTEQAPLNVAAVRHPVTGTTVVFSSHGSSLIDVWEQPASGGALNLIRSVPAVTGNLHYTARSSSPSEVVLHYHGPQRGTGGSYTIPVTASGGTLIVGYSKKISEFSNGTKLIWLPAANAWAFYSFSPFNRCWVFP